MNSKIASDYSIHEGTMAIETCSTNPNVSIVYERKGSFRVAKRAFDLIRQACLDKGWSDYTGRRAAVKHHMQYHYKVPIPVIPDLNVFFFPTHGVHNEENIWLNPDAIKRCNEGELPGTSDVQLMNDVHVNVLLQIDTLHGLYIRTLRCQSRFNGTDPFYFV